MEVGHDFAQALFRWVHVVAGVLWIGLLYYFNWVHGAFARTLDAQDRRKVLPELLPRALYFFRWGAIWTWVTGILLIGLVYHMGHGAAIVEAEHAAAKGRAIGVSFISAIVLGPMVYDLLWKSPLREQKAVALAICFALLVALMWVFAEVLHLAPRALYIHVGALFGTAMMMNVVMRIWPSQRKILAALRDGSEPDPQRIEIVAVRSRHNTYMSVPLLFIMVSNHHSGVYGFGDGLGWVLLVGIIVVGWLATSLVYGRSNSEKVARF